MTPIVLYRSNINTVQEADQNFQFEVFSSFPYSAVRLLPLIHLLSDKYWLATYGIFVVFG
jgi:hypothetical protein